MDDEIFPDKVTYMPDYALDFAKDKSYNKYTEKYL